MHPSSCSQMVASVRREAMKFLGARQRSRRPWAWLVMGVCIGWGCSQADVGVTSSSASGGTVAGTGGHSAGGSTVIPLVPVDAGRTQPQDSAVSNGKTCTADGGKCYAVVDAGPYCGDGVVQEALGETCDDGNRVGGDGCSGICRLEPNFECPTPGQPCVSTVRCGNGSVSNARRPPHP